MACLKSSTEVAELGFEPIAQALARPSPLQGNTTASLQPLTALPLCLGPQLLFGRLSAAVC